MFGVLPPGGECSILFSKMTKDEHLKYWLNSAEKSFQVAQDNFKLKHYNWCLFFCHLTLERILKGLAVKRANKSPLPIHNLVRLAKQARLALSPDQTSDFEEISSFNIEARYDDLKLSFYKKATKVYTEKWLNKCQEYFQWLKNQY